MRALGSVYIHKRCLPTVPINVRMCDVQYVCVLYSCNIRTMPLMSNRTTTMTMTIDPFRENDRDVLLIRMASNATPSTMIATRRRA